MATYPYDLLPLRRSKMKRILWIVIAALGILVLGVTLFGYNYNREGAEMRRSEELAIAARARVAPGVTRDEAVSLLSADAWHHAHCEALNDEHVDIFLYGSHDLNLTGVVFIQSSPYTKGGEARVTFVGREENYRLILYDDCSSLDLSRVRR